MREDWMYRDYLKDVTVGMLTGPSRIHKHTDDLVEGIKAIVCIVALTFMPFLFFLSPVFALMARESDRIQARRIAEAREEARRRIHQWGPDDDQ